VGKKMLIKLAGGVTTNLRELKIEVGATFLRYLSCGAYDKGEVVKVDGPTVVVDFMDSVRSFPAAEVTLVYGSAHEHLMFCGEGELTKDFSQKARDTPQIDSLEDLLDFDQWMV
jgi:hypothetical protein